MVVIFVRMMEMMKFCDYACHLPDTFIKNIIAAKLQTNFITKPKSI